MKIKLRFSGGIQTLDIDPASTNHEMLQSISKATGIPAENVEIRAGFPPKLIELPTSSLLSQVSCIAEGEVVTVAESGEKLRGIEPIDRPESPETPPAEPAVPATHMQSPDGDFCVLRRAVPADNQCLFASISYLLQNHDAKSVMQLRELVAKIVSLNESGMYNEAVLFGRSPSEYAEWIQNKSSWGGYIDIGILANALKIVIVVFDVQSVRHDVYGSTLTSGTSSATGNVNVNVKESVIFLIYDGIHYDPLVQAPFIDAPDEFDRRVFERNGEDLDLDYQQFFSLAESFVKQIHSTKLFTDTSKFDLRCLVCQAGLIGTDGAQEHAKQTGHMNFAEYS